MKPLSFFALLLAATVSAGPSSTLVDKNSFTLFNPTPRELMRPLSTDRPDKTESPFTVDAGHFQVEADVINYTYDAFNGEPTNLKAETWSFATTNLKIGLLNNVDLQVVVPTYTMVREEDRTLRQTRDTSGFGDLVTRLKVNLWGNDGGNTAGAVMPFIKFPTAGDDLGNDAVEGGIILPFAIELPAGWNMGVMPQFDFNQNTDGNGYHLDYIQTATVSHDIVGSLAGYLELFSALSTESDSDWVATFDCGFTFGVGNDIQLDAGINIGLTRAADDLNPFVGISWRF